ncbi:MAG: dTDP-4-dehydrorhamnose reductase [Salinivirgaceae bacterium]|jgi:dTDP-4-dehydrorhamnose reductase|nr:dTDP-4-dehydrorhamnose reductase [Salinivirgaceae bacterium]
MSKETILVTGAGGQLGTKVKEAFEQNGTFNMVYTDVDDLDITMRPQVDAMLERHKPQIVINCSAYTAVDNAEKERDSALKTNQKGSLVLAEKCKKHSAFLIHISTDYVFDGEGFMPYEETHPTRPVNFYGQTKVLGEEAILQNYNEAVIIRTAWLYSEFGKNFVTTMLRLGAEREQLGVIDDQVGTPTYAGDLADAILAFAKNYVTSNSFKRGIYHFTNEGACSWYDFALKIQQLANNRVQINPIPTTDYPTPAKRPHYSILNKRKIKDQLQIEIPHWEESLIKCIELISARQ